MNDILTKLINQQPITDEDIANELFEICDSVHASCDSDCPIFQINDSAPLNDFSEEFKEYGCGCFKNGTKMLQVLRRQFRWEIQEKYSKYIESEFTPTEAVACLIKEYNLEYSRIKEIIS